MSDEFLKEFLLSSAWEQMQGLLKDVLGTPMFWVADESGKILQSLDRHYPEFCRIIRSNPKALERCAESINSCIDEAQKNRCSIISPCHCGLIGYAIPFMLDDQIIGFTGGCYSIFDSPLNPQKINELSAISNINANELMRFAKKIKLASIPERRRIMNILTMFAGTTSLLMKWMNRLLLSLDWEKNYATKIMSLSEIGILAGSELNWEDMLMTISSRTRRLLDSDACVIYILDPNRGELNLSASDKSLDSNFDSKIRIGAGIIGHVAQTRLSIIIDNIETEKKYLNYLKPYKAILSIPLIAQDRLIGVIAVYSLKQRVWEQTDISFLSIISVHISGIIEKSKFHKEFSKELEIAGYIQAKLIPQAFPKLDGFTLSAITVPSREVSGDYYDFINIDDNKLGIVIADVSGKGLGASILMANARGLIHAYAQTETQVNGVLSKINNALYSSTEADKFMTMFYGVLDVTSGIFTYSNAGHNPPFLYKINENHELLEVGGIVLGIMKNMGYSESKVQLNKNDVIVFYSDGVTEAHNINGELFGDDRLNEIVLNYLRNCDRPINAQLLLDTIFGSIQKFSLGVNFSDDLTIAVLVCNREE